MAYLKKSPGDRGLKGEIPRRQGRKRRAKVFSIIHSIERDGQIDTNYNFILLPTGIAYNKEINSAIPGDKIRFVGNGKERIIEDIGLIDIKSSLFRNLCILRYGATAYSVTAQWKSNAVAQGYIPKAIDEEKAIIVWYREIDGEPLVKDKQNGKENDIAAHFRKRIERGSGSGSKTDQKA